MSPEPPLNFNSQRGNPISSQRIAVSISSKEYRGRSKRIRSRGGMACSTTDCRTFGLAKALEVLFPPEGDKKSRDAARDGLRLLGFSPDEIEGNILSAMALRNEIDVGHVGLSLFKMDQLKIIYAFTGARRRGIPKHVRAMSDGGS
jgi:hypothetical protein